MGLRPSTNCSRTRSQPRSHDQPTTLDGWTAGRRRCEAGRVKAVTVTTGSRYAAATANRLVPGRVVSGGGSLR